MAKTDVKALILTNVCLKPEEKELLQKTDIKKFALNHHAETLKPDFRICTDYGIAPLLLQRFSQKIITTRDYAQNSRLIYAGHIAFKGSTIVACIEYLIDTGFNRILIVGDNTVHSSVFQQRVNKEIDSIVQNNKDVKIYQYSNGNFNLPVISIFEFERIKNGIFWKNKIS